MDAATLRLPGKILRCLLFVMSEHFTLFVKAHRDDQRVRRGGAAKGPKR
jgi:predicted transposase YbfD/YdcC